ncbi:hemicentin-2-like [Colossoma macropomum]|uniref:hemicentin-2-like n=1 Tax=Colossoma macropomum TaxID=42526 RepID=UPI0018649D1C|nr:hemicentin-2-like [Colossoma macropomum]
MPGGYFRILIILQCALIGRGVGGQTVSGVLHGRAVLHTCHGHEQDVTRVEWRKYRNSTSKHLLYIFEKPNITTCITNPCIFYFDIKNMSLIVANLTAEDEGIYEEKTILNSTNTKLCNITLSVLSPPAVLGIAVSPSRCPLTLRCEVRGEFLNLRWLRNGLPLPEDQRISFNETNRTMRVSCLNASDRGTYTCQVSNAAGSSEAHVNITPECECDEPLLPKEEADTSQVDFLSYVDTDFTKPKASQQITDNRQPAEDFMEVFYTTADNEENKQPPQTT